MDQDAVGVLLRALATSAHDVWFVLPGVGWLTTQHCKAYEGRNPRTGEVVMVPAKRVLSFVVDREIYRELDGFPPSSVSFANERERFLHATRSGDETDPAEVTRLPGAESIAETIRARLRAGEAAALPGLGAFDVLEKPSRAGVDPETGAAITVPARRVVRFLDASRPGLRP